MSFKVLIVFIRFNELGSISLIKQRGKSELSRGSGLWSSKGLEKQKQGRKGGVVISKLLSLQN